MSIRWGIFTAAVLAAALTGCGSGEKKKDSAPPTTEGTPTTPETTGTPAPAADAPVELKASWTGEGEARKASVKLGDQELAQLDAKTPYDPKTMPPNQAVVDALKSKRDEAVKAGNAAPKLRISCPSDMDFQSVGRHLMKAAFNAGFKPGAWEKGGDVNYEAQAGS